MNKAINRTTVQVDENRYKLYAKAAPLFYKKPDGSYGDIDHTFNDTTSTIGDISLMDKGIVSVGKRKGNNPHKVVGIRPDNNQHLGTQQLEFSLVNVELDGESQDFNVEDDLEIKLRASSVFQLVKINKDFNNFKIEFDIHAKNLPIENNKYSETINLREYDFNLTDIGIESGDNIFNNFYNNLSSSSLDTDIPSIDIHIAQVSDSFITKGEYTNEEEFGSANLSNYNIRDMYDNGSAVYLKDSIVVYCKSANIDNFQDIMINSFKRIFNAEFYDDGGSGKYFTINNKKIGGIAVKSETDFLAFFNTKEIDNEIKNLFIRKTFDSTSFIDTTLDNFKDKIDNYFNIDLNLEVNSDYYKPINDCFSFNINNESFYIKKPILFDKDCYQIDIGTEHTLKDNEDGSYRYTKYFSLNGYLNNQSNIRYIDTALYVSHAEDVLITYKIPHPAISATGFQKTSSNFTTVRNASTGKSNSADAGDVVRGITIAGEQGSEIVQSGQFGIERKRSWSVMQSHYMFDSSGITDTVSTLEWKFLGNFKMDDTAGTAPDDDCSIIALKSTTTGANDTAQWNNFTGHTSGWGSSDVTEYSSEYVVDGFEGIFLDYASFVLETVPLNADAKTDLKNNNDFKMAFVEYDQYYLNSYNSNICVNPAGGGGAGSYLESRYVGSLQIDHSDSSKRPYLDITTGAAPVTYNANFFGANF